MVRLAISSLMGCWHAEMETDKGRIVTLPDDLIERILAKVPFPFVFKARLLSKSWLAKFSPISSEDNEEKKCLITSFQERLGESPTAWKTFGPILFCKEKFIAYDWASHQWRRMPSLSFLGENLYIRARYCRLEGALLLITTKDEQDCWKDNFYVANILTQSWKQLPPQRITDGIINVSKRFPGLIFLVDSSPISDKWLIRMSLQAYKVVVFDQDSYLFQHHFVYVYDSKLGAWNTKNIRFVSDDLKYMAKSNWALLNGVFYRVVTANSAGGLLTFNVKEENSTLLQMPSTDMPWESRDGILVVCKSSLLWVVFDSGEVSSVTIFKLELESRSWSQLARCPPEVFDLRSYSTKVSSDGDSLFIRGILGKQRVLTYNVDENEWSSFPLPRSVRHFDDFDDPRTTRQGGYQWVPSSFQPGLNTFVAI